VPNLLRNRNCFFALSYSIFDTARHWSEGGCTAAAGEDKRAKIVVMMAHRRATAALFLRLIISAAHRSTHSAQVQTGIKAK
jgi:hypothetical protein